MEKSKREVAACTTCKGKCMDCWYVDQCNFWNDVAPYDVPIIECSTEASMALCQGRHDIPEAVDGAIFWSEIDPLAVDALEVIALSRLEGIEVLNLYVTGLTVALVAALNACRTFGIKVTLYHFNRENGEYYPQRVV